MELNDTYDLEMLKSDLKSIAAEYKAGDVALQYIAQLEAEINRAMDAMFPNGWKPDDAMALGQTVEGMCEQLDKAVAWFEGDDSPRARLEAEVAKWEKIANEEYAQSAHIAMRNGELQAENEGLKEKIEILKMIVLESPEAIRLVRGVLDEIDTTNKK